jgi:hypothetical protein
MAWPDVIANDIVSRYGPLNEAQTATIEALISDAQNILGGALDGAGIVAPEPLPERLSAAYVRIVATMVVRVLRNPDGKLQETLDDYSYRRDSAVSAGLLYVSDDELAQLRPDTFRRHRGAFSITLA